MDLTDVRHRGIVFLQLRIIVFINVLPNRVLNIERLARLARHISSGSLHLKNLPSNGGHGGLLRFRMFKP